MEELLSFIVTKRHLDPRYYELALPPSKPKSMQAQFTPSTVLHALKINEIHVIKRSKPLANKKHQTTQPPLDQKKGPQLNKQKSSTLPTGQKKISLGQTSQTSLITQEPIVQSSNQKQIPVSQCVVTDTDFVLHCHRIHML